MNFFFLRIGKLMISDIVKFLYLFCIINEDYLVKEMLVFYIVYMLNNDLEGFRIDISNLKVRDMLYVYMLIYNGFLFNKLIKELFINIKS